MRYMLLIYTKEDEMARVSQEEKKDIANGHWAVMDETRRLGILQGAEPLSAASTATSVRRQDGKTLITDGPFAETREQVAGYYILDCKDQDEAAAWAAKLSTACGMATGVEIRRLPGLPPRDEAAVDAQLASGSRNG